jgi:drug/metabolite transporter (DMT)-like permease
MKYYQRYKPFFLILITALAGGGIPVFSKIALREINPLSFTLIRFMLAFALLFPLFLAQRGKYQFSDFKRAFFVSILGTINVTLFVIGVRLTTASAGQMLYTFAPLLAGALSYFLLKERLSARKITGILVGFIGALIIILLPVISGKTQINGGIEGNLLIFTAVCSFSLYSVLSKNLQKEYTPITLTTSFIITTILVQLLLLPLSIKGAPDIKEISLAAIFGCLYVGILGTGVYYLVYQKAIESATPVVASMVLYLQPIFTILWAIGLLDEKLSIGFVSGALLAFIGVALVTIKQDKK